MNHFLSRSIIRALFFTFLLAACQTSPSRQKYSFHALEDPDLIYGTGKLLNPPIHEDIGSYGREIAAFRGAALQLFGEPLWTTDLSDEAYTYVIEATDEQGNSWLLSLYEGPSGPAIGGNIRDQSILAVAEELSELLQRTLPADFEAITYSMDFDITIRYGCKDSSCYYEELPGNLIDQN